MTVNKLTRELKAKGCRVSRYTTWSNSVFNYVTYTEYEKNGKDVAELKRVKGEETEVNFIHQDFVPEFEEMGIEVGTILK